MDADTALRLAKKLQISRDYVVREEFEVLLLKEIFESSFGSSLIFKGGTALRLAYNSPRFSEDLDFDQIKKINKEKFEKFIDSVKVKYPEIVRIETMDKYFTLLVLIKIKVEYLNKAFSIKLEISKRPNDLKKNKDYSDKVIKTEVSPLTVLVPVASLEMILRGKADALKNRKAARDVFDYWYINQLLKKEIKVDFSSFDKVSVRSELHKLLAKPYWKLVDSWLD